MAEEERKSGWAKMAELKNARELEAAASQERIESLRDLNKENYSLGDLNPLIHSVNFERRESSEAMSLVIRNVIERKGGLMPESLGYQMVFDPIKGEAEPRFIARFVIDRPSEEKVVLLEKLVQDTYGKTVSTRTDDKGNKIGTTSYPPVQIGEEYKVFAKGWYMGSDTTAPLTSLHQGLLFFKTRGTIDEDNFLDEQVTEDKFIIEIREAAMKQADLATFIVQTASLFGSGEVLEKKDLLYETYYDLIRLGLKNLEGRSIYGMDDEISLIVKNLIIPLASPDISKGIKQEAQSVIMVGVPGTGKTLLVEHLLHEDLDVFIIPLDPFDLQKELRKPKDKQDLFPRIAEVSRITGKNVILHVDDIENMLEGESETHSTLLNLMAGIRESGFKIIASTNKPDKIDPALLQPQRLGVPIHCSLQLEDARYEILKIHATTQSTRLNHNLFNSEEERDEILKSIARKTDAFTPRYLANIATVAKSFFVERIALIKSKFKGLTEEDLEGQKMVKEDWTRALDEVKSKYDSDAVLKADEELSKFVKKIYTHAGFRYSPVPPKTVFSLNGNQSLVESEVEN